MIATSPASKPREWMLDRCPDICASRWVMVVVVEVRWMTSLTLVGPSGFPTIASAEPAGRQTGPDPSHVRRQSERYQKTLASHEFAEGQVGTKRATHDTNTMIMRIWSMNPVIEESKLWLDYNIFPFLGHRDIHSRTTSC